MHSMTCLQEAGYLDIASLEEVLGLLHVVHIALQIRLLLPLVPYPLGLLCSLYHIWSTVSVVPEK